MRRRRLLFVVVLFACGAGVAGLAADWWIALPEGRTARYVGQQTCLECHAEQGRQWSGSDHDLAMDHASDETVLGDFNDQVVTHQGVTARFFRRDGKFFVNTEGPTGALDDFQVKFTFGVRPLQQYLVELDGGRLQALSLAWDVKQDRWFHLYPDDKIEPGEWIHWTGAGQNWNYMCAECHSTNLEKNYDLTTNTYHTTYSEIDVSCETCHGPGDLHVELAGAKSLFWDRRYGYGLARLKDKNSKTEIEACAPCHSRRRVVQPGFRPGKEFLDHYAPELLDGELYHVDGQILDEDYVYGSFLQSVMHAEGVRCTDCHDPHTAGLKAQGNALCTQCHVAGKYDGPVHHHHPPDSTGAQCVECHMPERTYMVVDPRRDHSIRSPRPDLTIALGTPNACNGCHQDKDAQWAQMHVGSWYEPKPSAQPHFAHAIAAGRASEPRGEEMLAEVARRLKTPAIVRASAVALLRRYGGDPSRRAIEQALDDAAPLVRAAAVGALADRSAEELAPLLTPRLTDPVRLVRIEAARLLARAPEGSFDGASRDAFRAALDEYIASQQAVDDQPAAHLNLGVLYGHLNLVERAESAYRTALRLDADFIPARFNLAMLYDAAGEKGEAETLLREVIELDAAMAEAHYSLGLLVAEQPGRMEEAAQSLGEAAKLSPDNGRMQYNHGLALQHLGRPGEAEKYLRAAVEAAPAEGDYLRALGIFYSQQNRAAEALVFYEAAVRSAPGDAVMWLQYGQLLNEAGEKSQAEQALLAAQRLVPNEPQILHALTMFYAEEQRWEEALAYAERLAELRPEARPLVEQLRAAAE